MKARLNITIEEHLLEKVKAYAVKKQVSISSLIEAYLENIVHVPSKRNNIINMIDKLQPDVKVVAESNKKKSFYEGQKEKYGF